jgi:LmbE family N-acetylglucosaminyl deacetylase
MLPIQLGAAAAGLEVLCIGAHSDDLELGCGGTILRLLAQGRIARITWVVLGAAGERAREAQEGARLVLGDHPDARVVVEAFRDGFFPYDAPAALKEWFERTRRAVRPDVVFTHYRHDRHQDHRLVSDLTYNTFRDHLVLEYEVMKVDGDLGNPNVYVALDAATVARKVAVLEAAFPTQRGRRWFDAEAFRALMRLRGIEAGAPGGYAEAFQGRKLIL